MRDSERGATIRDYGRLRPFCGFLPGIAGETGIPLWCYYVNRGQAVCSFGVESKDNSIMEFSPAHQAYQQTGLNGFRTFIRLDGGGFAEPFGDAQKPHEMITEMNALTIRERDAQGGLTTEVCYTTLPEERVAGLIRRVTITNDGDKPVALVMLDGMPAIIPYGVSLQSIKSMAQTSKAWMQAEDLDGDAAFFRVRASMEDTSVVKPVDGVSFACVRTAGGERPRVCVDPTHVFGYDCSFMRPLGFIREPFGEWTQYNEATQNIFPCCFYSFELTLEPRKSYTHYMLIGHAESKAAAGLVCAALNAPDAFERKIARSRELAWALTAKIATETSSEVFDMYCRQTYLDNFLRGGYARALKGGGVMYLYSRKHGDPERDYNAFRMLPEYMSQGNGNYRDVNQNRRCDVLFEPRVGEYNIRLFINLIQADGYNPLVVERVLCRLNAEAVERVLASVADEDRGALRALLSEKLTAGRLRMALNDARLFDGADADELFETLMSDAGQEASASFGEGYWSDHWVYNQDLIESYLSVYPEREEALLYDESTYTWYDSPHAVLPRARRCGVTERGVRQLHYLGDRRADAGRLARPDGEPIMATLIEKLLLLCAVKCATLDFCGMGVEMEGGKPGWYDALNGLPALFGSSVPEALALCRLLCFVRDKAARHMRPVAVLAEAARLMRSVKATLKAMKEVWLCSNDIIGVWAALNDAKEKYRAEIYGAVSGDKLTLAPDEIISMCDIWLEYAERGVSRAMEAGGGLCPTYFTYDVTSYREDAEGLHITEVRQRRMPDFLEGQVGCMRLNKPREEKERLYAAVRQSALYDGALHMYKVNAPLDNASFEIGRARAFTPGWLENESIWLHMEYKYLLELLRSGLYDEFEADFKNAAIPFLSPEVYGRSTLENSSFIASSANPDPHARGKGYVARLSGSTAEFLSIWQIMLLGERLFTVEDGVLTLRLSPMLPPYLTEGRDSVEAVLLGCTSVVYHIDGGARYIPERYDISDLRVEWRDGGELNACDGTIRGADAERVRNGEARRISMRLKERDV